MTTAHAATIYAGRRLGDNYLVLLAGVLLGYAMLGKGFAYLGFPPIYVGEAALLAGIVVFLRSGCFIAVLASIPSVLIAAMMIWVLMRTLPFVAVHGFDALRDSAVVMYGGFAFIVIALLLEDARRLSTIIGYYRSFLSIYVPAIPFIFPISNYLTDYIPHVPGTTVPLLWIGPGEVPAHLAGAAVFTLVGLRKPMPLWTVLLFAAVVEASAATRGGMLAFVIPVTFAALVCGKVRELAAVPAIGLVLFLAAYAIESSVSEFREATSTSERQISTRQLIDNAASIAGQAGEQTEGTKQWRLDWWNIIINNTIYGPYFWMGRGFGINLGQADGFGRQAASDRPLRSPHSVHMTILARTGVPGLACWAAVLAGWFAMLMRAMWSARCRHQNDWAGLFLFVACYLMAIIINATFDVALEGPVQGIWFWSLLGFGTGAVMVYRAQAKRRMIRSRIATRQRRQRPVP